MITFFIHPFDFSTSLFLKDNKPTFLLQDIKLVMIHYYFNMIFHIAIYKVNQLKWGAINNITVRKNIIFFKNML